MRDGREGGVFVLWLHRRQVPDAQAPVQARDESARIAGWMTSPAGVVYPAGESAGWWGVGFPWTWTGGAVLIGAQPIQMRARDLGSWMGHGRGPLDIES